MFVKTNPYHMKKLGYLLSLFILLSAFTCEDEPIDSNINPNANNNSNELVGQWRALEFSGTSHIESEIMGISINQDMEFEGANMDYILTLDGSNFSAEGDYDVVSTTTMDGQTFGPSTQSMTNVTGGGTYTTSGNTITLDGALYEFDMMDGVDTASSGPQTANYSLSANGQILTIVQDSDEQNINQAGMSVSIVTSGSSVWERID